MQAQAVPVTLGLILLLFCCHVLHFWGEGFWFFVSVSMCGGWAVHGGGWGLAN